MEKHYKTGNKKIDASCMISCLPTSVCFGKGKQCKGCYAYKSEIGRFKAVVSPSRKRKLQQTKAKMFVANCITEIVNSKRKVVRIHESGDFYSQSYINKYIEIIKACPEVRFYTYTKKLNKFDFSGICKLANFNLVNSITPFGLNFGSMDYCKKLVKKGYKLCPCGTSKEDKTKKTCMESCDFCAKYTNIVFLQH